MAIYHHLCRLLPLKCHLLIIYGIATSTYFIGLDMVGIGFGPSLLGLFTGFISYTEVYIIMAIVAALCTVLYFIVHGRKVKTQLN